MSLIGSVTKSLSAGVLDKSAVAGMLGQLIKTAELGSGLKGLIGGLLSQLGGQLAGMQTPGAFNPPAVSQANVPQGLVDKALYLSVLRAAMQKATQSQHFNVETHINDLWIKLSQVRQNTSETEKLQQLMGKQQQMFDMLRQIVDSYDKAAKGVIQSIGR